jgi:hypothetical protein
MARKRLSHRVQQFARQARIRSMTFHCSNAFNLMGNTIATFNNVTIGRDQSNIRTHGLASKTGLPSQPARRRISSFSHIDAADCAFALSGPASSTIAI